MVFPFGLCNTLASFWWDVTAIFSDLMHDCVEIYMDEFTIYDNIFEWALSNLKKVLERSKETHLALINTKCHMLMKEVIVLAHYISIVGIKVDPTKIKVILSLPSPKSEKGGM